MVREGTASEPGPSIILMDWVIIEIDELNNHSSGGERRHRAWQ